MAKGFYLKLACGNLRRNRRMYIPYFIASVIMSGMYFIIFNLIYSKSISNMSYGPTMQSMFLSGILVMTLFIFGYMLYINSFLIKKRKKEFGLYAILGLEKRHVGRIILWENILLNLVSLIFGILSGLVFGRLVFWALMNVMHTAKDSSYSLVPSSFYVTAAVFCIIFVLTTLYNLFKVRLANPIDLINGEKKGEKKLRGTLPIAIVGFLLLGGAYYIAITCKNTEEAVTFFWLAVIMVILATWFLFTAGSVFILSALKKNKKFYYKPQNFIAVSGLTHRIKQNAAGLANICILSTMVMVTVSCCCSLFFGQEDILSERFPNDIIYTFYSEGSDSSEIITPFLEKAQTLSEKNHVKLESAIAYPAVNSTIQLDDKASSEENDGSILFLTADTFSKITGKETVLSDRECLVLCRTPSKTEKLLQLLDELKYSVAETVSNSAFTSSKRGDEETLFVVFSSQEAVSDAMKKLWNETYEFQNDIYAQLNVSGAEENCLSFTEEMNANVSTLIQQSVSYSDIFSGRLISNMLYGGLLFLGAFFTILFLTNTVLIIYFKQVSEGMEDREQFEILQKVGMDDVSVKRTINRQIMIVFFLPLIAALLHIAAASKMIIQMMKAFLIVNSSLTLLCIGITAAVFALVYTLVFRLTAKTYYKIVKW